ncbi:hypothetical protein TrLO_g7881 [Triparma laevis f. longispina]|uniref:Cyclin N-terminal domain-containing protein n=1 Tax=Triparma laevis f. longispina TaxID=1714387 RepID=A0A9W7E368_9STRA|nr:hypothetical protein TrLO_g7881 [Triparma laevis f. longispina]
MSTLSGKKRIRKNPGTAAPARPDGLTSFSGGAKRRAAHLSSPIPVRPKPASTSFPITPSPTKNPPTPPPLPPNVTDIDAITLTIPTSKDTLRVVTIDSDRFGIDDYRGGRGYEERLKVFRRQGDIALPLPSPTLTSTYLQTYGPTYYAHLLAASTPPPSFLNKHPQLTCSMLAILLDWLVELTSEYSLSGRTLHHCYSLLSRFLELTDKPLSRGELQLLGCSCMLVSGKVNEIHPPGGEDFEYICDHTYTKGKICSFELEICSTLKFKLESVTPYDFIPRFISASAGSQTEAYLVEYICELSLLDVEHRGKPCLEAAAAVYLARLVLSREGWSETLKYYTGYGVEDQEFRDMVKRLHLLHWEAGEKGKASWNKFRTKRWGEVALRVGVNEGELGF